MMGIHSPTAPKPQSTPGLRQSQIYLPACSAAHIRLLGSTGQFGAPNDTDHLGISLGANLETLTDSVGQNSHLPPVNTRPLNHPKRKHWFKAVRDYVRNASQQDHLHFLELDDRPFAAETLTSQVLNGIVRPSLTARDGIKYSIL